MPSQPSVRAIGNSTTWNGMKQPIMSSENSISLPLKRHMVST